MNAKQIITSNKTIIAAALLTLGLTGCSTTQSINYTPQANVMNIAGASHVEVNVVTTDSRADKAFGKLKSAAGVTLGSITAKEPVEITVWKAIETELKNRGFDTSNKNANLSISTEITKFDTSETNIILAYTITSNMDAIITVNRSGKSIYTKKYMGLALLAV
jgi:uncharacterized lipoprotein YajG